MRQPRKNGSPRAIQCKRGHPSETITDRIGDVSTSNGTRASSVTTRACDACTITMEQSYRDYSGEGVQSAMKNSARLDADTHPFKVAAGGSYQGPVLDYEVPAKVQGGVPKIVLEGGGPVLPEGAPPPSNLYCPVMGRYMLWAPPFNELTAHGQAVGYDYYWSGYDDGKAMGILLGYRQGRYDEAEHIAALQRRASAVARSVGEPYWDLAEHRGEHERAQKALQRAKEKGYYI